MSANFKCFEHETLDSTSTCANRLIEQGEKLPFAVWAKEQTAGRGRRGRSWLSPKGGFYLSIAHAKEDLENLALSDLGLFVAITLIKWMQKEFHIAPTIKWPNDILFSGQKLAGILCETSVRGDNWQAIIIGIGINLTACPKVEEYESVCLAQITDKTTLSPSTLIPSFIAFWQFELDNFDSSNFYKEYALFHLPAGQPWHHDETPPHSLRTVYQQEFKNESATLWLADFDAKSMEPHPFSLTSAHHSYRWAYQKYANRPTPPLLIADIGNSSVKLALYADAYAKSPIEFSPIRCENIGESVLPILLRWQQQYSILEQPGWPIFVASVNNTAFRQIEGICKKARFVCNLISKRSIRWWGKYRFHQLGMDRLAFMEGWLAQVSCQSQSTAILVSLGTATTVDVLKANGEHLGGFIIPGLQTSLNALQGATNQLPQIFLNQQSQLYESSLGRETKQAMIQGTTLMTKSLIDQTILICRQTHKISDFEIILTGGLASWMKPHFQSAKLDPTAIVDGIRRMVIGG